MLQTKIWKYFTIGDLFDVVKGTKLKKSHMKYGDIRFIGASDTNNGMIRKIANKEHLHAPNTITVCCNNNISVAFYQNETFWAADSVNVLYPKFDMNRYIALFICTVIDKAGQKYKHSGKWTRKAMAKEKIKLPVTNNDEPDYDFMENYMKMLEKKVLTATQ